MTTRLFRIATIAAAGLVSACTVHQVEQTPLAGPSSTAVSIIVTATPDRITQDGASQSTVAVRVIGPAGRPMNGMAVRMDMFVGSTIVDFGTLAARTIVTGSDGTARTTYTAPPAPPPLADTTVNTVSIRAVPVGNDAQAAVGAFADIRLMPAGVILPPAETPTAAFIYTPTPVQLNAATTFDASTSCGGSVSGTQCTSSSAITSYQWNFGDGGSASGKVVTYRFAGIGTFNVTLTVTNDRGISASTTQLVSVGASPLPSGDWVNSPVNPVVGDTVFFNATNVKAAPGRTISRYDWNFGDGTFAVGILASHAFTQANTYAVVLTATDDLGQALVIPHQLTIGTGAPLPVITFSPGAPTTATTVSFDGTGTVLFGGASIASIAWSFGGPGAAGPTDTITTTMRYSAPGTYTVRLTITDSLGRVGTATITVTVT